MRPPLFRSFTFVLGAVGLIFLAWAWVDSTRTVSRVSLKSSSGSVEAVNFASALEIRQAPAGSMFAFKNGWSRWRYVTARPLPPIWWQQASMKRDPLGLRQLVIPHWLILYVYVAIWAFATVWRRHRWRKARRTGIVETASAGVTAGNPPPAP